MIMATIGATIVVMVPAQSTATTEATGVSVVAVGGKIMLGGLGSHLLRDTGKDHPTQCQADEEPNKIESGHYVSPFGCGVTFLRRR